MGVSPGFLFQDEQENEHHEHCERGASAWDVFPSDYMPRAQEHENRSGTWGRSFRGCCLWWTRTRLGSKGSSLIDARDCLGVPELNYLNPILVR